MTSFTIRFETVDNATSFVRAIEDFHSHFDLVHNKYTVDAQSLLGVMTLNLKETLDLRIMERDGELEQIIHAITPYIAA